MKLASRRSLEALQGMLSDIRRLPDLVVKKTGTFYLKGQAFLHFHEDPQGLVADAKVDGPEFVRFPVNSAAQKAKLLGVLRKSVDC
jgi:hypothetical protein